MSSSNRKSSSAEMKKENRTLRILQDAVEGKYGVLAAVAYVSRLVLNKNGQGKTNSL